MSGPPLPGFGDNGFSTLSRYDDVVSIHRDVDRWSADYGQGPMYVKGVKSDPPEHTLYRRLINHSFTPRTTEQAKPKITEIAHGLIDGSSTRDMPTSLKTSRGGFPSR